MVPGEEYNVYGESDSVHHSAAAETQCWVWSRVYILRAEHFHKSNRCCWMSMRSRQTGWRHSHDVCSSNSFEFNKMAARLTRQTGSPGPHVQEEKLAKRQEEAQEIIAKELDS